MLLIIMPLCILGEAPSQLQSLKFPQHKFIFTLIFLKVIIQAIVVVEYLGLEINRVFVNE